MRARQKKTTKQEKTINTPTFAQGAMERSLQALLVSVFVAMLGLGIVSPILPLYAENLGATFTQIGLLVSSWSIARLIFSAPAGRLSDTVSRKKVIMGGLFVYAVVSLLYIFAWDFTSLLPR